MGKEQPLKEIYQTKFEVRCRPCGFVQTGIKTYQEALDIQTEHEKIRIIYKHSVRIITHSPFIT